jgi:TolB-like protein/DNA-binding winged helix-turn-helix (wHTH) protein/Flp pilus assembly protein TadD
VPNGVVKFAEFELDRGRYELRRGESVLKIEKIPMELLVLLVESNGQLVTRDEIVGKIWGKDVFLDTEHGINTAIRKIRQTLGDDPDSPRFVQTVTGKGYRFIATTNPILARGDGNEGVRASALVEARQATTEPSELGSGIRTIADVASATEPKPRPGRAFQLAGMAFIASVGIGAVLIELNVSGLRDRFFSPPPRPRIHSLAVLPLENLSADPGQEYFADGMTDELITMLTKNPGLRVISRTSAMQYKKVHGPLPGIARELGVDGILEGSVERSAGRVHLNVQLVHAPSDTHLWAESYDRDLIDLGSLQTELAQTIAKQVGTTISVPSASQKRIRPEAHDAYMLGKYYWFTSEDTGKVREFFQRAIDLQPDYAAAWSGLADSYLEDAIGGRFRPADVVPQGEVAARKAIALDDSLPEAHNSMAAAYLCRWDWQGAERESARAVELNPNFAEGHHLRAYVLQALNRTNEALEEQKKATGLDPVVRPWALSRELIRAHQFDAALTEARLRSQAQPDSARLHNALGNAYLYRGMEKDAVHEWETSLQLSGDKASALGVHRAFERGGITAVLEWQLSVLQKKAARKHVSPLDLAEVCASLKRKDETLHYLEEAYKERSPWLVRIQSHPGFDFLHSDPRYQAIVKKMGLTPAL